MCALRTMDLVDGCRPQDDALHEEAFSSDIAVRWIC